MKFTITQEDLTKMLRQVSKKVPWAKRADLQVRISACAARVFVESNDTTAGIEALVLQDGCCTLPRGLFTKMVRTYSGKTNLMIEANDRYIQIANTRLNVSSYSNRATPPAPFRVFPVKDTWVAAKSQ